LKNKLPMLGVVLLALIAMLGASASIRGTMNAYTHSSTLSGNSQAIDEAETEFKTALMSVRDAEAAGADKGRIAVLVERLNMVVGSIDEAERLHLQGNITEADAMARQTIDISKRVVLEAVELRDEASMRTYREKIFAFGMAPVASLLLTVGAHHGWKMWRRREVDRIMRMEIKKIKEPEEE